MTLSCSFGGDFIKRESELLFKSIENLVKKMLKGISYDKEGFIISSNNSTCTVIIDSQKYAVKNGTNILFNNGDKCLVHYINGSEQNKVIIAKL